MPPPHRPAIDRIFDRLQSAERGHASMCWIYTGTLDRHGYGRIGVRTEPDVWGTQFTHRVVYEHYRGAIPGGLELDHLCRQHDCCNPMHLEAVTHAENVARGDTRQAHLARYAALTHCKSGHEFTEENTYMHPSATGPRRQCRICRRDRKRSWRQRTGGA